eukprot:2141628-Pyramimonas_sp.AAC.1
MPGNSVLRAAAPIHHGEGACRDRPRVTCTYNPHIHCSGEGLGTHRSCRQGAPRARAVSTA